jgi:MFS family permease
MVSPSSKKLEPDPSVNRVFSCSIAPDTAYNTALTSNPPVTALGADPQGPILDSQTVVYTPGRRVRAWTSIGSHSVVDFLSFVPIALMPLLKQRAGLSDGQVAILIATQAVSSGAIQPVAAWISDKFDLRAIASWGMAAAGLGVGMLVFATDFLSLLMLTILAAAGVGAFHPPAAAAVGSLALRNRAMWVSLFFVAGMTGGVCGNLFSPRLEELIGLRGLLWLILPTTLIAIVLWVALRRVPHRKVGAHETHASLSVADRRARWGGVWLLYIGNVIRFGVNNALIYLVIALLERGVMTQAGVDAMTGELATQASTVNGRMQAAMQLGMGGGALAAGWLLAKRGEKLGLILTPLLGAAAIFAMPVLGEGHITLFLLIVASGIGFGSMVPITISLAQRMLPHRTSLASALMLGGAWMFAGIGALSAQRIEAAWSLGHAFQVVAIAMLLASLLSIFLPGRLVRELDH